MGRKIYQLVILLSLIMPVHPTWSLMLVEDPSAIIKFGEMLQQGRNQIEALQGASNKLTSLNQILGNDNVRIGAFTNGADLWGNFLTGFGSLEADQFSILNQLGYGQLNQNYRTLGQMGQFVTDKLFVPRENGTSVPTIVTSQKLESIKQQRMVVLEKASVNGLAVSGKSKHELLSTQRKIAELGRDGSRTTTVLEALIVNNKLLSVIASELVQQREIQTQQLELISAFITQSSALVTNTQAPRRH